MAFQLRCGLNKKQLFAFKLGKFVKRIFNKPDQQKQTVN